MSIKRRLIQVCRLMDRSYASRERDPQWNKKHGSLCGTLAWFVASQLWPERHDKFSQMMKRLEFLSWLAPALGWQGGFIYLLQRARMLAARLLRLNIKRPIRLYSKRAEFPLICRPFTSDKSVFNQIFVRREYQCLDDLEVGKVGLVLDCGANVGYSSAYFLSRFLQCKVIAIEPDLENFSLLRENLLPYAERVETIRAAIWSHPANLVFCESVPSAGGEWRRQLREARPGELADVVATEIGSILKGSGYSHISILKIDVEGAEAEIFGTGDLWWLRHVDNIVIELHSGCRKIFLDAITGMNFEITRFGELTVCRSVHH